MQPAVRLLLGSLPQPVFFIGVISRIAVGGGVRGRQFGESATNRQVGAEDGLALQVVFAQSRKRRLPSCRLESRRAIPTSAINPG
jgi:hypothetical protein